MGSVWRNLRILTSVMADAKGYLRPVMAHASQVMRLTVIESVNINLILFLNVGLNVSH